jgi:hypothetical protein
VPLRVVANVGHGSEDVGGRSCDRLGGLVRARGRPDEADELAAFSSQTAPSEGLEAQALSKAAMAQAIMNENPTRQVLVIN